MTTELATLLSARQCGQFARWCALQVAHLWSAPAQMLEFLKTGNDELRRELIASKENWKDNGLPGVGVDTWKAAMMAAKAALNYDSDKAAELSTLAVQRLAWHAILRATEEQNKSGAPGAPTVHSALIVAVDTDAIQGMMERHQAAAILKIIHE